MLRITHHGRSWLSILLSIVLFLYFLRLYSIVADKTGVELNSKIGSWKGDVFLKH